MVSPVLLIPWGRQVGRAAFGKARRRPAGQTERAPHGYDGNFRAGFGGERDSNFTFRRIGRFLLCYENLTQRAKDVPHERLNRWPLPARAPGNGSTSAQTIAGHLGSALARCEWRPAA